MPEEPIISGRAFLASQVPPTVVLCLTVKPTLPFLQLCGSPGLHNRLGSSLCNLPPTSLFWARGREHEEATLNVRGAFWEQHSNLSAS